MLRRGSADGMTDPSQPTYFMRMIPHGPDSGLSQSKVLRCKFRLSKERGKGEREADPYPATAALAIPLDPVHLTISPMDTAPA